MGEKAVNKYNYNMEQSQSGSPKKVSQSERAGLLFPVGSIARVMKERATVNRVGGAAPIFMAAVLEYMLAELVELAVNCANDNKNQRVSPRHIALAVANDSELTMLLPCVTFRNGGVLPNIHQTLLP